MQYWAELTASQRSWNKKSKPYPHDAKLWQGNAEWGQLTYNDWDLFIGCKVLTQIVLLTCFHRISNTARVQGSQLVCILPLTSHGTSKPLGHCRQTRTNQKKWPLNISNRCQTTAWKFTDSKFLCQWHTTATQEFCCTKFWSSDRLYQM